MLRITSDGSHTIYVPQIDECYHSTNGALQESMHIFIRTALHACAKQEITVFEVGFGTGLNAFLTLLDARERGIKVNYIAVELYPIDTQMVSELNYAACANEFYPTCEDDFAQLHRAKWNESVEISPDFLLTKIHGDLNTFQYAHYAFDVVYFDAFSPEKQPEMWSETNFNNIFDSCNSGAILTTYCAKGAIRRSMQAVGFTMERLAGPPGKREILRARVNK